MYGNYFLSNFIIGYLFAVNYNNGTLFGGKNTAIIQHVELYMKNTISVGQKGEDIACAYLAEHGFTVIERNYRRPWGEIDIVARDAAGTLVFVEVKTLQLTHQDSVSAGLPAMAGIMPEDNMTRSKLAKTKKIAVSYANSHPELIDERLGWRIDMIAITIPAQNSRQNNDFFEALVPLEKGRSNAAEAMPSVERSLTGLIPLEVEARCVPSRPLTGLTDLIKNCEIKYFENVD